MSGGKRPRPPSDSLASPPPPFSPLPAAYGEFLHGFGASAISILLTFPLSKLTSRQAYEGLSAGAALGTMRREGAGHLYRGLLPPLLQKGVSIGVCYGAYDYYFHVLTRAVEGREERRAATDVPLAEGSLGVRAAAAIASGSTEALFTPFERVQTILQHRHYTEKFDNTYDVITQLRPYGVREYFRGATAILLRNGPSNAAFFMLREPMRSLLPPLPPPGASAAGAQQPLYGSRAAWDVFRDFFSGAVLGATLSTIFYPVNMAKSVMQLQIGGPFRSVAETLAHVHRERGGVAGLYHGVGGNAVRALLSWGIVNSAYEILKGRGGGGET